MRLIYTILKDALALTAATFGVLYYATDGNYEVIRAIWAHSSIVMYVDGEEDDRCYKARDGHNLYVSNSKGICFHNFGEAPAARVRVLRVQPHVDYQDGPLFEVPFTAYYPPGRTCKAPPESEPSK